MARTLVRRIAFGVVVLLVVGGAVLVLVVRGDLEGARSSAEDAWEPLGPALDERYDALDALRAAVVEAGGIRGGSTVERPGLLDDLAAASADWRASRDGPVADQVEAANELEGLARRLVATVDASPRLNDDADVAEARTALLALDGDDTRPDTEAATFNEAAAAYEDERGGPVRGAIASILGYDALPALDLADLAPEEAVTPPA